MDKFTNKAQFDTGFLERVKLIYKGVPDILDPHHTSVSNCYYYVITIALSVITDCLCTDYYVFSPKSQQHPSVKYIGCQTYTTVIQS